MDDYGWIPGARPPSHGYIAPAVEEILRKLGAKTVCDIGSGDGSLAQALQDAGFYVAGVERDRGGFELSQKTHPGINFYRSGVEDDPREILDSEGLQFDAVVSTEVVEHLFSPHHLPIFASRLLVTDGWLIVSTPYHGYLKNFLLALFGMWDYHHHPLKHGGHIKFWSPGTLTRLLEQNGFEVEQFKGVGRLPWIWKSMILVARLVPANKEPLNTPSNSLGGRSS